MENEQIVMTTLQMVALAIYVVVLAITIKNTDFKQLLLDKDFQHRLFGASAIVFIIWVLRVGIVEGLYIHFLWLTALALLVGFRWAVISSSIVLLGATIVGQHGFAEIGINGLLIVLLPICLSYTIYMVTFHKMKQHIFIYIFICAFLSAGLSISVKMLAQGFYFYLDLGMEWASVKQNFLNIIPLVAFPEALFNGMIMTILIVYKSDWVYTFNDKFYIDGK